MFVFFFFIQTPRKRTDIQTFRQSRLTIVFQTRKHRCRTHQESARLMSLRFCPPILTAAFEALYVERAHSKWDSSRWDFLGSVCDTYSRCLSTALSIIERMRQELDQRAATIEARGGCPSTNASARRNDPGT